MLKALVLLSDFFEEEGPWVFHSVETCDRVLQGNVPVVGKSVAAERRFARLARADHGNHPKIFCQNMDFLSNFSFIHKAVQLFD